MSLHHRALCLLASVCLVTLLVPVGVVAVTGPPLVGEVYDVVLEPCGLLLVATALEGAVYARSTEGVWFTGLLASHLTSPASIPGEGAPVIAAIGPDGELIVSARGSVQVYYPPNTVNSSVVTGDPESRTLVWVSGGRDLTISLVSIEHHEVRQLTLSVTAEIVGAARGDHGVHVYWVDDTQRIWWLFLCDSSGPGEPREVRSSRGRVTRIKVGTDGSAMIWDGRGAMLIGPSELQLPGLRLPGARDADWWSGDGCTLVAALIDGEVIMLRVCPDLICVARAGVCPRTERVVIDGAARVILVVTSDGREVAHPLAPCGH